MLLTKISKFYNNHQKLCKNLLNIFVFSHPLRTYIKMVLEYPDGPTAFLEKSKNLRKQYNPKTKYFLSMLAIVKNEGANLQEWIEYHRIIGFEKFYIYDNESTDNTQEILKPYVDKGIVKYHRFPGEKIQLSAYNHFLENHKQETNWVAVIDLDEFIVSKKTNLPEFLKRNKNVTQILVPWVFFGSNGHIKKPNGLTIENYTKRAKKPRLYKGIINPQLALNIQVHKHDVAGKTIFPKMTDIMINHYYCKSWEEYQKRANRGDALRGKNFAKTTFNNSDFQKYDFKDQEDTFILQYADEIKQRIKNNK